MRERRTTRRRGDAPAAWGSRDERRVSFFSEVFGTDVPTAAGGGEEDVFECGVSAAEAAQTERLGGERAEQRFAELFVAIAGECDAAETGGVGFALGGDA